MTITNEQTDAIKYFMGWKEGDNITITSDFVSYAEELYKLLEKDN